MHLPLHALELAEIQLGVLTRRQLLQSGVTPAELRTRIGREWRLLLRGVILLGNGLPDVRQRLVAALLYAGPDSWLAGSTAAALHGVPGLEICRPVRVLVAAPHRARDHAWVSIRNTTLVDERVHERGALRLSCPARAVVLSQRHRTALPDSTTWLTGPPPVAHAGRAGCGRPSTAPALAHGQCRRRSCSPS